MSRCWARAWSGRNACSRPQKAISTPPIGAAASPICRPDGTQTLYAGATADLPEGLRPNGIALEPDGSFLLANLGSETRRRLAA